MEGICVAVEVVAGVDSEANGFAGGYWWVSPYKDPLLLNYRLKDSSVDETGTSRV